MDALLIVGGISAVIGVGAVLYLWHTRRNVVHH